MSSWMRAGGRAGVLGGRSDAVAVPSSVFLDCAIVVTSFVYESQFPEFVDFRAEHLIQSGLKVERRGGTVGRQPSQTDARPVLVHVEQVKRDAILLQERANPIERRFDASRVPLPVRSRAYVQTRSGSETGATDFAVFLAIGIG